MNKRIEELADRLWRVQPSDIDAMGLKSRTEFYEHELKKFAESVVQECANFCADIDGGENMFSRNIRRHYGVE